MWKIAVICRSVTEGDCTKIDAEANRLIKTKQVFERCELTKEQALQLFSHNPFKMQIISNKVADGAMTRRRKRDCCGICTAFWREAASCGF